ncbi:unnamed protein product [Anisakis simplex]|uniref:Nesprin-1 n=1 Tax=Anisakis simplex TaxID=6269 RepID=A0A158PN91_ANISI|nr:unnamed protein product [Anisakis simplex]
MSEDRRTQESSRAAAHAPVWSVTRRQRTEVSPLRDAETGTQSYRSRTMTTTERVQVVQTPVEADGTDFSVEVLSSTAFSKLDTKCAGSNVSGQNERWIESTTMRHEAGGIPVVGGITASGVPLYSGIWYSPESTETTTIITTTTTTYRVFEVESDESAGEENGKESELTINFPLECESSKHADIEGEVPDGEPFYVVIGKKDTLSPVTTPPEHVVKTVDINVIPTEPTAHDTQTVKTADVDGNRYPQMLEISDHDGKVSRKYPLFVIGIRYVNVYHNGRSDGLNEHDELQITDEISTMVAKLSGSFKRAAVHGEHTIYLPVKGRKAHDHQMQYAHDPSSGSKPSRTQRELKSKYTVKFSDPFRIEADVDEWTASTSKVPEIPEEDLRKHVNVYHSGLSDRVSLSPKRTKRREKGTRPKIERTLPHQQVICTEETDLEETYQIQRLPDQQVDEIFPCVPEQRIEIRRSEASAGWLQHSGTREPTKPQDGQEEYTHRSSQQKPEQSVYMNIELRRPPRKGATTIQIVDEKKQCKTRDPYQDVENELPTVTEAKPKFTGLIFKRGETYVDYPTTELYEGPVDATNRAHEVEGEPLEQHVSVYHSGRSDEVVPVKAVHEEEEPSSVEALTGAAQAIGARITGLFKKSPAHLDYPTSEPYEGPFAITNRTSDVEGEPLRTFVSVYHSGRSDEPITKVLEEVPEMPSEELPTVTEAKPKFTEELKQSLFAMGIIPPNASYADYPKSLPFLGPHFITPCMHDLPKLNLSEIVHVYHSGRSDECVERPTAEVSSGRLREVPSAVAGGYGIANGLLLESSEEPLSTIRRTSDVEKVPLQHYVNVYGSGIVEGVMPAALPPKMEVLAVQPAKVQIEARSPSSEIVSKVTDVSSIEVKPHVLARERPPEIPKRGLIKKPLPPVRQFYSYDVKETRTQKPKAPQPPQPCREIVEAAALARQKRLEKERHQVDLDVSINAKEPLQRPSARPPIIATRVERDQVRKEAVAPRERTSVLGSGAPSRLSDYYAKTREVDYWIGRHTERYSRPPRDLTADIGIDVASDEHWEEKQLGGARRATSLQPESIYARSTRRDIPARGMQISTRSVSPTAHLHWTTVSETTSVSYSKKVSIERRRPRPRQSFEIPSVRRQYRPPPPPPEVAIYGRSGWTTFDSDYSRPYSGVAAIRGESRQSRYSTYARYGETSGLGMTGIQQPTAHYVSNETRVSNLFIWIRVTITTQFQAYRNPLRYDLPSPVSPPRYEHWAAQPNSWTVEGSPRRFHNGRRDETSYYGSGYPHTRADYRVSHTGPEFLHYQNSNLEEIPIVSLMNEFPMIEEGATECLFPTVQPIRTHDYIEILHITDLPPGEHARSSRSAPLRRARQRIRNYCTML